MRGSRARIVRLHDGRDHGDALDGTVGQHDRIVSVDGSEVATQSDLGTLMQNHKAGDTIEITVARGGQMQTVNVTLGEKGAENN